MALPVQASRKRLAPSDINLHLVGFVGGLLAIAGTAYAWMRRRHRRRLQHAQLASPTRNVPGTAASSALDIAAIVDGPDDVAAAQGHMMIAATAEKRGEWVLVLQECDKALARLWTHESRKRADILYPDLQALRAFALACVGRYADAELALQCLGMNYPQFERAAFRVHLVEHLQGAGVREAAAFAEAYAFELPLSVREELLADLTRVIAHPERAGLGEVARLRDELEKTDSARMWIQSISPGLLGVFQGAQETDISTLGVFRSEAEREAEAELDLNVHPARVMFSR